MRHGTPTEGVEDAVVEAPEGTITGVVEEVLHARNYRHLTPAFVARIARDEWRRSSSPADAVKRTKRKLHQVAGAYLLEIRPPEALAALTEAHARGEAALKAASVRLMARHASTRERVPFLDTFYQEILALTGRPQTVLDLACGLGPLAVPWMDLPANATYHAFDVDDRLVEVVRGALHLHQLQGQADLRDVVAEPPMVPADVALLLKSVPCLEQQQVGSAAHLLHHLHARHLVVSFPRQSLGGAAGKGMLAHYRQMMETLLAPTGWNATERLFPTELVFVIRTNNAGHPSPSSDASHVSDTGRAGNASHASDADHSDSASHANDETIAEGRIDRR